MNPHTHETQPFNSAEEAKAAGHTVPVATTAPQPEKAGLSRAKRRKLEHRTRPPRFQPAELDRHLANQAAEKEKKRRKAKATAKMKRAARQKAR